MVVGGNGGGGGGGGYKVVWKRVCHDMFTPNIHSNSHLTKGPCPLVSEARVPEAMVQEATV